MSLLDVQGISKSFRGLKAVSATQRQATLDAQSHAERVAAIHAGVTPAVDAAARPWPCMHVAASDDLGRAVADALKVQFVFGIDDLRLMGVSPIPLHPSAIIRAVVARLLSA